MLNKSTKKTGETILKRFLNRKKNKLSDLNPKRAELKSRLLAIKKTFTSLPELKKTSSVKHPSLRSRFKYIAFVIEPHWQYFYRGSKSIGFWCKNSSEILWQSKRGKVIIGQIAVIAILAALLVWQYKPKIIPLPKSIYAQTESKAEITDNLGIRRYLPTAREYIPPTAFEPVAALAEKIPLSAWIAPWNIQDQKDTLTKYASISAFWLTLDENGYDVNTKGDWEPWLEATKNLKPETVTKWLSISGNPDFVFKALTNQELENKLIENLVYNVEKWGFDGIDIDFEGLGPSNKDVFSIFIKHLAEKFHGIGKLVSVTVEVRIDDPPMDWPALAQYADEFRPMFYDYHARHTGYPGPVAPLGWISEKMQSIEKNIPLAKVVPALGNYGYDWQKSTDPLTINEYQGVGLSFEKAVNLAVDKNQQIGRAKGNDPRGYDIGDAPHFSYLDESNNEHHVWFEDKISLSTKANLLAQYQPKSIIFWNVGSLGDTLYWQAEDFNSAHEGIFYSETEDIFNTINNYQNAQPTNTLTEPTVETKAN